jgi:hypothetical protein
VSVRLFVRSHIECMILNSSKRFKVDFIFMLLIINVREYLNGNQKQTIQRNWQDRVHKTKKNTTQYVLDTPICKQTQIRNEPSYNQLKVKTNRKSFYSIFFTYTKSVHIIVIFIFLNISLKNRLLNLVHYCEILHIHVYTYALSTLLF